MHAYHPVHKIAPTLTIVFRIIQVLIAIARTNVALPSLSIHNTASFFAIHGVPKMYGYLVTQKTLNTGHLLSFAPS